MDFNLPIPFAKHNTSGLCAVAASYSIPEPMEDVVISSLCCKYDVKHAEKHGQYLNYTLAPLCMLGK